MHTRARVKKIWVGILSPVRTCMGGSTNFLVGGCQAKKNSSQKISKTAKFARFVQFFKDFVISHIF